MLRMETWTPGKRSIENLDRSRHAQRSGRAMWLFRVTSKWVLAAEQSLQLFERDGVQ